jgi:hypothetical protein
MAFIDKTSPSLDKSISPRVLGLNGSGSLMAALMGHGYRENNEDHMKPIMDAWLKFTTGNQVRRSNKAMKTGLEMEQIATRYMRDMLRTGSNKSNNSAYKHARLHEANRSLYLESSDSEGSYGRMGIIDGPLQDIRGKFTDPRSGELISGVLYAERQALEKMIIDRRIQDNEMLMADGDEPLTIPLAKYNQKLPWLGHVDVKVTQMQRVLDENKLRGMPPGWVIHAHHSNELLREDNKNKGHDETFENLMGVYQFCTEMMDGYFYEIEHDPELVAEMERRWTLFKQCVTTKVPPTSTKVQAYFFEYPVKAPEPTAIMLEPGKSELFARLIDKRERMCAGIDDIEKDLVKLDAVLQQGWEQVNQESSGTELKSLLVGRKDNDPVLLSYGKSQLTSKTLNKPALNNVLDGAVQTRQLLEKMQEILTDEGISAEQMVVEVKALREAIDRAVLALPGDREGNLKAFEILTVMEAKHAKIELTQSEQVRQQYEQWHAASRSQATQIDQQSKEIEKKETSIKTSRESAPGNGTDVEAVDVENTPRVVNNDSNIGLDDNTVHHDTVVNSMASQRYLKEAGNQNEANLVEDNAAMRSYDRCDEAKGDKHESSQGEFSGREAANIAVPQKFPGF